MYTCVYAHVYIVYIHMYTYVHIHNVYMCAYTQCILVHTHTRTGAHTLQCAGLVEVAVGSVIAVVKHISSVHVFNMLISLARLYLSIGKL